VTRRRLAAAVGLGAVLYTGAFSLVLADDLGDRRTLVVMVVAAGLIFTVTGAIAAARRPDNPTGSQMLAVGLLWSLGSLQAANGSIAFIIVGVDKGGTTSLFYNLTEHPQIVPPVLFPQRDFTNRESAQFDLDHVSLS